MQNAITELLKLNIKNGDDLMFCKRKVAKKYGIAIPQNSSILKVYQEQIKKGLIKPDLALERILRKRAVRTLSGIAPVAVLTKPFPCPGKCAYCPTEKDVPQSYLSNEPAVMRAIRCDYDPYVQVQMRLRALEANGHKPEKIELIVIGGTWSVLPDEYKFWFISMCFKAANDYAKYNHKTEGYGIFSLRNSSAGGLLKQSSLQKCHTPRFLRRGLDCEQKKNEKAKYRIIGVTLETRPDYINEKELLQMRELGCTRVELGVQAIDDEILKLNKRGHGVDAIAQATELLKNFGFKVTYHIMPGLPGSTAAKDLKMFKQLFTPSDKLKTLMIEDNDKNKDAKINQFINDNKYLTGQDERFQPDQIKFYPTVVTRGSLLYKWWKAGKYKPYSDKVLRNLIINCKKAVPEYVRIIRLIRDIPGESIIAGNKITNLRQVMKSEGVECRCIRCREAGELTIKNYELRIIKYNASGGEEYFISYESKDKKILYGFCRLRLPGASRLDLGYPRSNLVMGLTKGNQLKSRQIASLKTDPRLRGDDGLNGCLRGAALIRELHVYGELVPVGGGKRVQHAGLGRKLMAEAEKIARSHGFEKMAVISGVGVRGYYRKLGYRLKDSYMIKRLI